jgi:hypothetical protein
MPRVIKSEATSSDANPENRQLSYSSRRALPEVATGAQVDSKKRTSIGDNGVSTFILELDCVVDDDE